MSIDNTEKLLFELFLQLLLKCENYQEFFDRENFPGELNDLEKYEGQTKLFSIF